MRLLRAASKQKPAAASLDQLLALSELLMQTCMNDPVLLERLMGAALEALQHFRKHEVCSLALSFCKTGDASIESLSVTCCQYCEEPADDSLSMD